MGQAWKFRGSSGTLARILLGVLGGYEGLFAVYITAGTDLDGLDDSI